MSPANMTPPPPIAPRLDSLSRGAQRRLVVLFTVLLAALFASLVAGQPAHAQGTEVSIRVQVKDQRRDAGGRVANEPVAGVSVTVFDADGNEVGSGVTDESGVIDFPVPGKADYRIVLDESTLPEGLALAAQTPAEQSVDGETGFVTARRVVNYFTGESQRVSQSTVDRWAQRFADGLRLGLIIAICSVGLSLIFGTTGLTNFAHGEMVTFGAMIAWFFNARGLHIIVATVLAVAAGGLLGYCLDRYGFEKLRNRGVGLIPQMIITIGMSIFAKNLFLARFGGSPTPYFDYTNQVGKKIGPVVITQRDLTTALISLAVLTAIALTLQYTQLGKATRAVSDNRDLASATGINTTRIVRMIWVVGAALAALGGVFRGLDESVDFNMGGNLLFLMFAAITLGGLGSAYGALFGGLIVGIMVEVSTLFGVPTDLKAVRALAVLMGILLVGPQGMLGRGERVG